MDLERVNNSEEQLSRQRDFVANLYADSFGGIIVTTVCAIVLVFGFENDGLTFFKYVWGSFFAVLMGLRFADALYWHNKLRDTGYEPTAAKLRFIAGAISTACLWSVYSIVTYSQVSILELATTIIVLSSLAGGSATVLSGDKKLAISYCVILLVPLSFLMSISADSNQNVLGFLGFFFTIIIVLASFRAANFTENSINLKNRNTTLVNDLASKNAQISLSNKALEEKVESRTQEIYALSNIDPLTGLFNRTAFSRSLNSLLSECRKESRNLALLFIDLDGFKAINDTQGHAIGDRVLVAVSQRLVLFAKGPAYICRWGGDEFIIVIEDVSAEEAVDFGRDLIKSLSQRIQVELSKVTVGATIGVAMYPEHGEDESELISLADTAMYFQKAATKSDIRVFSQEMRQTQLREQDIKEGLAQALYKNEFYLVYQPVIDNVTKKVSFCEVLLRWNLNGHLVPPQEFIPIAEQYGFIHEVGEWVLKTACSEASNWVFDDSVDLSVNVSVAQLVRSDFIDLVKQVLASSGLPGTKLHIEITESLFASDMDIMMEHVKALQALGVKVSVDDFGTGFSSLSQLQTLSADIVKIDRSFISSMDTGGQAIIQATQYMANEFGYTVVAEGVETKKQADELTSLGITCSQGYYFSQPMPIEELPAWFDEFKQNEQLPTTNEDKT